MRSRKLVLVMSLSTAASLTSGANIATSTQIAYNFSTSSIVRAAVAAGIIVLALAALVLFFKVSRREQDLNLLIELYDKSRLVASNGWQFYS